MFISFTIAVCLWQLLILFNISWTHTYIYIYILTKYGSMGLNSVEKKVFFRRSTININNKKIR
jgi:hypothetical protein